MSINLKRGEYGYFKQTNEYVYGKQGFIGWERLTKTLKNSGELKPGEKIIGLNIDEFGISFVVEEE